MSYVDKLDDTYNLLSQLDKILMKETNNALIIKHLLSVADDLASSAPIDYDKVSSIKKAISSGNYPLDLDKISDALMEAYNELKS